ncbi:MAG: restriction endonuclease subunit S [Desulfitobacteriia bacterium]
MSKWEVYSFEELIFDDTKNGNKVKKEDYLEDGLYPIIDQGQKQISGYRNTADGLYENIPAIIFGDHTRVIKYIDTPFFLGAEGVKILKSKRKDVSYKYLYYFFTKNEVPNTGYNRHFKWLKELSIPLPPLETQKQIAKTLDTASELLAMRKQQLAELDNLIKSVFYDMFGDPVENNIGWPVLKIQDIANVETGSTPKRSNINYYFDGSIPWVKTGEISNKYIYDSEEKITELALIETNCKLFPTDTLLIAMYGQGKTRGQIGMLKVEATTNQACAAILPNDQFVSQYLFKLLEIRYEDLRELGRGGNQPNLNLSMVKNFEIIMPPLSLQTQFASIVNKIEEQKALVQKAIDETQYLLDSLMSGYFDE